MLNRVFQVEWEGPLEAFRSEELGQEERRRKLIWEIASVLIPIIGLWRLAEYTIGHLVSRVLLPSTGFERERIELSEKHLRNFMQSQSEDFQLEERMVQTPDGAVLKVYFIRNRRPGIEQFVLCFNPRSMIAAEMAQEDWWYRDETKTTPSHFVFFDYRGTGSSGGEFCSFRDLVIDGLSVVQWIQKEMAGFSEHIGFYGRDLGGAVAASVQVKDPLLCKNWHINDRSFSSICTIVSSMFGFYLGLFLSWILRRQGYEVDSPFHILDLPNRVVLHHPQDGLVSRPFRLAGSTAMQPAPRSVRTFNEAHHHVSLDDCSKGTLKHIRKVFNPQPGQEPLEV